MDRTWPDDRHFYDEIVEFAGLEARQHRHLRATFDLEDAGSVGPADHVVNTLIVPGDVRKRQILTIKLLEEFETLADAGEHSQRQHVDLEQAELIQIVLIPFDEGAALHGRIADGHDVFENAARDDETARMLAEMARKARQFAGEAHSEAQRTVARVEADFADVLVLDAFR